MPTRTRKPRAAAETPAAELDFNPNAVADTSGEFFDSANREVYSDTGGSEDDNDGNLPPEDSPEDNPSAGQPLGRTVAGMSQGQQAAEAELKDYIRRMENLASDKQDILDDIKELKKEIKGKGYDTKAFDLIMKLSGMTEDDKQARRQQNSINATYAHAVGIDETLL